MAAGARRGTEAPAEFEVRDTSAPVQPGFEAENLVNAKGAWRSAVAVERSLLRLRLTAGPQFVVRARVVNDGASHVEVRGCGEPDVPWHRATPLLPRTELRSMWEHKRGIAPGRAAILVMDPASPHAGRPFEWLLVCAWCLWTPLQPTGLARLQLYAAPAPPPAPAAAAPAARTPADGRPASPAPAAAGGTPRAAPPAPGSPRGAASPRAAGGGWSPPPSTAPPPRKPGGPLAGCVICLSGQVHPERGELRGAALRLGATIADDWGPKATHAVCAFRNTPKHRAVHSSGHGVAVSSAWLRECLRLSARVAEAPYALPAPSDPAAKRPRSS
eukprot:TRINITY_DN32807_c0_g1_i1.p2 TRINITY_DN32807_c0_g1~~TRINITY_DN32807_c0_g1_i1.p2  ORF type:complete len:359 (+),score=45.16 TRINITY_DN32807_c0_g1_i1:90-1079(+)